MILLDVGNAELKSEMMMMWLIILLDVGNVRVEI